MARYERAETIIALALALQAPGRGLSLDQIRQRFEVSRRTAERLRDAVARLFPGLVWESGCDGHRYWKLRRGAANGLMRWSLEELKALERSVHLAREGPDPHIVPGLESAVEKVRSQLQPPDAEVRSVPPRAVPAPAAGATPLVGDGWSRSADVASGPSPTSPASSP